MVFRKRKNPTPGFRMPPPYQPVTGEQATLNVPGTYPYCTLVQIVAEDTETDYVVCRGFDPRFKTFYNYEFGNDEKPGMAVAKPYGKRQKGVYHIGQIFPALLPIGGRTPPRLKMMQNPGTASLETACFGQPNDLTDELELLYDSNDKLINWMLIDGGPLLLWVELQEDLYVCEEASSYIIVADENGDFCEVEEDVEIMLTDPYGVVASSALAVGGQYIRAGMRALAMAVFVKTLTGGSVSLSSGAEEEFVTTCGWVAITFGTDDCCQGSSSSSRESESESESESQSEPSSSAPCLSCFTGVCVDDLPEETDMDNVAYVVGITTDGCLVKVPVSPCDTSSSSGA